MVGLWACGYAVRTVGRFDYVAVLWCSVTATEGYLLLRGDALSTPLTFALRPPPLSHLPPRFPSFSPAQRSLCHPSVLRCQAAARCS